MGPELILVGSFAAAMAVGWVVFARILPQPANANQRPPGHMSIIIPARNEVHNLPRLLQSIASQSVVPLEVIVANDASTDGTGELADKLGARVVNIPAVPTGWLGKTWACQQGAEAAQGELLLFVDADTWFEDGGLERLLAGYPGGAWSIGPYHAVAAWHEQLSLFFNLNMMAATIPDRLFGQVLLVERANYLLIGGHASVKDCVLENHHLTAVFRRAGIGASSAAGVGMVSFRMYPDGLRDLIGGWSKGFVSGTANSPRWKVACLAAWLAGLLSPFSIGMAAGAAWLPVVVYFACACQVSWLSRQIGSYRIITALAYPIPLLFFFLQFFASILTVGKATTWKGRTIRAG